MSVTYGAAPTALTVRDLAFEEYMHFMYLPVLIPEQDPGTPCLALRLPDRLEFAAQLVHDIVHYEMCTLGNEFTHVYVTARRGYATPGNPLNRPGWHSDGFGTTDVNYVWTDRYPTLFAEQSFVGISTDHIESARQFEEQVDPSRIRTYPDKTLMRLDPSVIHAAPEIPAPGGERSFFKVSFANARYNLRGNSHNYLLDYDWPMHDRAAVRNDPAHTGQDGGRA
ncbi:MAG TPA: hypothetical protein VN041_18185 [Microbacterium sp.]|nr:hypothetical protein [Microbacterium sp.]